MTSSIETIDVAMLDGVAGGIRAQVSRPAAHLARPADAAKPGPRISLPNGPIKLPLEIVDHEAPFVMP